MNTTAQPLYLQRGYSGTALVSQVGSGKTVTAKICASKAGAPAAIGSLSTTAAEGATYYTWSFTRAALSTALLTDYLGKSVYLHVDDGAQGHEVLWLVVVNDDEDTDD